jgi:flap endonuclease-1
MKFEAKEEEAEAKETGNIEDQLKFHTRQIYISKQMKQDAVDMLRYMGFPVIEAPCEAEAQCVDMVKKGLADAVASEDYDCLTFGATVMLAGFKNKKEPVKELTLSLVLEGLALTMDEFIDLCILCGCDYVNSIKGLGPNTILKLIQEHSTIEKVVAQLKSENENYTDKEGNKKDRWVFPTPADFQYEEARALFNKPEISEVTKDDVSFPLK